MARVTVVDASVLIAFMDPRDVHHVAAVEMRADGAPPLIVHPVTAAEVLVAPVSNGQADEVWADLLAIGVELDDTPMDPMQFARLRVETGCRLPDCCVLSSAAAHGVPVATFDERLRRSG